MTSLRLSRLRTEEIVQTATILQGMQEPATPRNCAPGPDIVLEVD